MVPENKPSSGREQDEASIRLLKKLKEQLCSSNASARRQAAFNLSWMQEDGLEILKDALFSDMPSPAKNAAAYGLRKMRGRMKRQAIEVLKQGLEGGDDSTKEVCRNSLVLVGELAPREPASPAKTKGKLAIREVRGKKKRRKPSGIYSTPQRKGSGNRHGS
ncbi:MAG: hypothetical protein JSU94_03410 [Phycisphaerales bacterium]|nr:MAG: hypothetical protein JSU94_03410 [Phycisphaerales bacterium]